jgi:hypothetical protein
MSATLKIADHLSDGSWGENLKDVQLDHPSSSEERLASAYESINQLKKESEALRRRIMDVERETVIKSGLLNNSSVRERALRGQLVRKRS